MKEVTPKVFLIGKTEIDYNGLSAYFNHIGALKWGQKNILAVETSDPELLTEVMSRSCYKSFGTDLNPNITKVREGNDTHLANIIKVGHGSVLEHAQLNFMFCDVSRVLTHELVRHRVGVAISQESLRYVRLANLSTYIPECISENQEALTLFCDTIEQLEKTQKQMAEIFDIENEKNFTRKKMLTSAFRRVAPIGLATNIGWSCNFRTLRHVLEMRTNRSAEAEIRCLFAQVYYLVKDKFPNIFADYSTEIVDGFVELTPRMRKV